jgi:hypothetical protein
MIKITGMKRYHLILIALIQIACLLPVSAQQTGNNSVIIRRYLPPDIYYPPGREIRLEKIDLNKAELDQLLALPEINEDLALKIMQRRPIDTLEDLYNLPYINIDRAKIIIDSFSGYVKQPLRETDELKQ